MANNSKTITLAKGQVLFVPTDDVSNLYFVTSGSLTAYSIYGRYQYEASTILCSMDMYYGVGIFTYVANEETVLEQYSCRAIKEVSTIFDDHSDISAKIVLENNRIVMNMIKTYLTLNMKCRKKDPSYTVDSRIDKWELDRYNGITLIDSGISERFFGAHASLAISEFIGAIRFATILNDANAAMADFMDINMDYVPPAPELPSDLETVFALTDDSDSGNNEYLNAQILSELKDSYVKIIRYSGIGRQEAEEMLAAMDNYKKGEKAFSDDEVRKIRRQLNEYFYKLYYACFIRAVHDPGAPSYVTMFLNFGFIDETLLSEEACLDIYNMAQDVENTCNNSHVHTMFDWLSLIMSGAKAPSKNAMDQTFDEYCKEQFTSGKMRESDMARPEFRVRYEIENMFTQAQRMTYGRVGGFVPFLTAEHMVRSPKDCWVSSEHVMQAINNTRSIDFSLFYRSTVYSNEQLGIGKEFIYTEVLPDIILTPCYGNLGAMWQEIDGRVRISSARFMLPIFCNSNLNSVILNILGKFRWELCKRIQGAYWNNIAEPSLTSEYFDYMQFYKKNHDLTEAIKEKIKSALVSAHNNFGEVFARDYENWILYESNGINKLNKVSRIIFAKNCPFNKNIRATLAANPAYAQPLAIYDKSVAIQKHRIDLTIASLNAKGLDVPREIRETKAYLNK